MAQVRDNSEVALSLTQSRSYSPESFPLGEPDPGWLKHSVWDSQLPNAVQLFDEATLIIVSHACTACSNPCRLWLTKGAHREIHDSAAADGSMTI
jgi:hypothetical protein